MKAPGELFDLRMPGLLRGGQEGCGSSRVRRRGWIDAHGVCVCVRESVVLACGSRVR